MRSDPKRKDRAAPTTAKRKFTTYPLSLGTAVGLPGSPNKQLGSLPAVASIVPCRRNRYALWDPASSYRRTFQLDERNARHPWRWATALRAGVSINWLSLSALWRAVITAPMGSPDGRGFPRCRALRLWQSMPSNFRAKIFVSITFAPQSLAASLASKIAIEDCAGACRSLSVDRRQPMLKNDSRGIGSA